MNLGTTAYAVVVDTQKQPHKPARERESGAEHSYLPVKEVDAMRCNPVRLRRLQISVLALFYILRNSITPGNIKKDPNSPNFVASSAIFGKNTLPLTLCAYRILASIESKFHRDFG